MCGPYHDRESFKYLIACSMHLFMDKRVRMFKKNVPKVQYEIMTGRLRLCFQVWQKFADFK